MHAVVEVPEFVLPQCIDVTLASGKLVKAQPATIEQIVALISVAAPVVRTLLLLPPDLVSRLDGGNPEMADLVELYEVFSDRPTDLTKAVAIAMRLSDAEVGALLPDEFAFLFALMVKVNADFFSAAAPRFAAAGRVLRSARETADSSGKLPSGS